MFPLSEPPLASVLVILGSELCYAFAVLSGTSITRSRTAKLRELAKQKYFGAQFARVVLTQADRHLLSVQLFSFLSALVAGGTATGEIVPYILQQLPPAMFLASEWTQFRYAAVFVVVLLAVGTVGLGFVQFFKAVALSRPNRILCLVALAVLTLSRIFAPIIWLLRATVGKVLALMGIEVPVERELAVSAEEISELVEMSSKAGRIEEDEREMIQHVFTFSDTLTREVMTPRADIVAVGELATLPEIMEVFARERLSRLLVIGSDLDDVKGLILAKDFLPLVGKLADDFALKKYVRPALFVSNSKKVDELLQELRRESVHFAVVLDEHGGVDGVVTLEDLVEEIVGEIFDEFDSSKDEADVRRTTSGDLLVDGSTIIDDLNANHHLNIPKGAYDTIAGFVIHRLGRIPHAGEQLRFENLAVRIEEVSQNRVTSVRISVIGNSRESAFGSTSPLPETQSLENSSTEIPGTGPESKIA